MTKREAVFVDQYLVLGMNGTKAAIAAGYSEKRAVVTASELLKRPHVATEIARRGAAEARKAGLTAERVVAQMARRLGDLDASAAECRAEKNHADLARVATAEEKLLKLAGRHLDVHGFHDKAEDGAATGPQVAVLAIVESLPREVQMALVKAVLAASTAPAIDVEARDVG